MEKMLKKARFIDLRVLTKIGKFIDAMGLP